MKILPLLVLGGAGAALGFVAMNAPQRDYRAPTREEVEAHAPAPQALAGTVPEGCVVHTLEVQGMCCTGCTGKLYAKLRALPGVVDSAVSFDRGTADVVARRDCDVALLERALTFDKYTAHAQR